MADPQFPTPSFNCDKIRHLEFEISNLEFGKGLIVALLLSPCSLNVLTLPLRRREVKMCYGQGMLELHRDTLRARK